MTYFEYLESLYVTTNLENQKAYSPWLKAETEAIHGLLGLQKFWFKWLCFGKVIGSYFLMRIKILPIPRSSKEIIEEYNKKALEAQEKAKLEQAKGQGNVLDIKPQEKNATK